MIHLLIIALLQVDDLSAPEEPLIRIIGKQFVVAWASAVSPLRKPGAETVIQMPGFFAGKPYDRRGIPGVLLVLKDNTRIPGRLHVAA
ncbi:MAG: hypothetical protein R2849_22070 [Thermomicrobiales bacterium]